MTLKKSFALVCTMLTALSVFGCTANSVYENTDKGISISYGKNYTVEEAANSIRIASEKNKIEAIITITDVYDTVSAENKELLTRDRINIQSGAFETTYNNYIYAGKLFAYLLDGNTDDLIPTWTDKTTFGTENYIAYYAALDGKDKCGYIYETVQNAKLYIICIYIDEPYDAILDYSENVADITDNITFINKDQDI